MRRIANWGVPAVLVLLVLGLHLATRGALVLGPDEGMEDAKALLVARQPGLAASGWNDQPWFFSQILARIGGVTGGRTLVVLAGAVALGSLRRLLPDTGWAGHAVAGVVLLAWPWVPTLSVSAMCEWPAFCLALAAAASLPGRPEEWTGGRFFRAGVLLAVGVAIKFTALIVVPAALVRIAAGGGFPVRADRTPRQAWSWWSRAGVRAPVLGLVGFAATTGLIMAWSPAWNWSLLWSSHAAAARVDEARSFGFDPWEWTGRTPGSWLAAGCGLWLRLRRRQYPELVFPLTLLATALFVHAVHRPFWFYYGIHLAMPLALLGAAALTGPAGIGGRGGPGGLGTSPRLDEVTGEGFSLVAVLAVSLWLGFEGPRGVAEVRALLSAERPEANPTVAVLGQFRDLVRWGYGRENIWLSRAGLLQPPELTILSRKRFWSGALTRAEIPALVRRYDCEILVLEIADELRQEAWRQLVTERYLAVQSDGIHSIYVNLRLAPVPIAPQGPRTWERKPGL